MNWFRIFKKQSQTSVLPPDLTAAIEACWIVERPTAAEDEPPRVFFALSGRPLAPLDNAEAVIRKIYPELSQNQVNRAICFLEDQVRQYLRESALRQASNLPRKRPWKDISYHPREMFGGEL